jgi:hypothetical protein
MTDAIFGCLLEKTRLPGYNHVLGIVLNGCCKLTDIGIRWLSQCFPKLKEVNKNNFSHKNYSEPTHRCFDYTGYRDTCRQLKMVSPGLI